MAYGCAVIISGLEPLPEVIPDGEVGFAVPCGDVPSLANRMELLVSQRNLLRQFQAHARSRYGEYHAPEVVAKQLARVFEQVFALPRRDSSL